jgi:hypothetical protein
MPRTSRAMAVLDKHEGALKAAHQRLIAEQAGVEAALERIKTMRQELLAIPRRANRAKRTVSLPAQPPAAA